MAEHDTYPMPREGWVCFHCGERFRTPGAAEGHFGRQPEAAPACALLARVPNDETGRGLVMALRQAEYERDEAIARLVAWRLGGDRAREDDVARRFRATNGGPSPLYQSETAKRHLRGAKRKED